jgi:hypothetical protein
MKKFKKLTGHPGDADAELVKKLVQEGKELMTIAHSVLSAIVLGRAEEGAISRKEANACAASYRETLTKSLEQNPGTVEEAIAFFRGARQQLIEAGRVCKSEFPEIYASVVSQIHGDPFQ